MLLLYHGNGQHSHRYAEAVGFKTSGNTAGVDAFSVADNLKDT